MKYEVGDLLETSKKDIILIAEINGSEGLVVGYWCSDYLKNIGYTRNIDRFVETGTWKHYPVVK